MFSKDVGFASRAAADNQPVRWTNDSHPDSKLRFQVLVPAGLIVSQSDQRTPAARLPGVNLVTMKDQEIDHQFEVLVQAAWVKDEVSLRDFFLSWARIDGDTVLETKVESGDEDRVTLLATRQIDGQPWTIRRSGFKVGNGHNGQVLVIHCSCPTSQLAERAMVTQSVVASFQPLAKPVHPYAEPLRLVTRAEPVDFASYLPISWIEMPYLHDQPGPNRLTFLKKLNNSASGVLSIVSGNQQVYPTREAFLRDAVSTWQTAGVDAARFIFDPVSNLGKWKTVRGNQSPVAVSQGQSVAYNLEFLLADTGSHWFYADVFGPSPEQGFEAWAINHRALDIFARQFRHA